ncbi:MAG: hypothetical protein KKF48_03400 [Nanoarchaeota archaeon]|nr:hypothetical protein [Nanoarchaeota archaeon]MBU1028065.1 hypothetical protein [Nanoarchaeota archaeon]
MQEKKRMTVIFAILLFSVFSLFNLGFVFANDDYVPISTIKQDAQDAMNIKSFDAASAVGSAFTDSIDPYTGALTLTQTDVYVPGRNGMNIKLTRQYNSNIFLNLNQELGLYDCKVNTIACPECKTPDYIWGKYLDYNGLITDNVYPLRSMNKCSYSGQEGSSYTRHKFLGWGWDMNPGKIEDPTALMFDASEGAGSHITYRYLSSKGVDSLKMTLDNNEQQLILPSMYRPNKMTEFTGITGSFLNCSLWSTNVGNPAGIIYSIQDELVSIQNHIFHYGPPNNNNSPLVVDNTFTAYTSDFSPLFLSFYPIPDITATYPGDEGLQQATFYGKDGREYIFTQQVPFCNNYDDMRPETPTDRLCLDIYSTDLVDMEERENLFRWSENPYAGVYLTGVIDTFGNQIDYVYLDQGGTYNPLTASPLIKSVGNARSAYGGRVEFYYIGEDGGDCTEMTCDVDARLKSIRFPSETGCDDLPCDLYRIYNYDDPDDPFLLTSTYVSDSRTGSALTGTKYEFEYGDPDYTETPTQKITKELTRIKLPTGAIIEYTYAWAENIPSYDISRLDPSYFNNPTASQNLDTKITKRVVAVRRIINGGSCPSKTLPGNIVSGGSSCAWVYQYKKNMNSDGLLELETTIYDPFGEKTIYNFFPSATTPINYRLQTASISEDISYCTSPEEIFDYDLPVLSIYPEDYSFRAGLPYKITSWGDLGGDQGQQVIKEETNYWRSQYPFLNPADVNSLPLDFVEENIGFKARVKKDASIVTEGIENTFFSGGVSYSIALIPRLEAKKTVVYDKYNTATTYGTLTRFDDYGNPKIIYDLGDMGTGNFLNTEAYYNYNIRNPLHIENPLTLNSKYGNLRSNTPITYFETEPLDTKVTHVKYLYEKYPFGNNFDDTDYEYMLYYPNGFFDHSGLTETNVLRFHAFYGRFLPLETYTKDAFGRTISDTSTHYQVSMFKPGLCDEIDCEDLGNLNQEELLLLDKYRYFEPCDADPFSLEYYNCLDSSHPLIHPFDDGWIQAHGEAGNMLSTKCLRVAPNYKVSRGDISGGFYALAETTDQPIQTRQEITYDSCGNVVDLNVNAKYKHPYEPTLLIPHNQGTNDFFERELLANYSKTVSSSFSNNKKIKPTSVTIFGPPDITMNAEYYDNNLIEKTINERGVETNYEYDELGRIKKFWTYPDDSSSPTAEYSYMMKGSGSCPGFLPQCMIIYEKRKIDDNKNFESYYIYDGLGRLVQTQTLDNAGTTSENDNSMIVVTNDYDVLNRVIKETKPQRVFLDDFSFGEFYPLVSCGVNVECRTYDYDLLDRVLKTTDFDGTTSENNYLVNSGYNVLETTDPLLNVRKFYSDARGNLISLNLPAP